MGRRYADPECLVKRCEIYGHILLDALELFNFLRRLEFLVLYLSSITLDDRVKKGCPMCIAAV